MYVFGNHINPVNDADLATISKRCNDIAWLEK